MLLFVNTQTISPFRLCVRHSAMNEWQQGDWVSMSTHLADNFQHSQVCNFQVLICFKVLVQFTIQLALQTRFNSLKHAVL